MSTVSPCLPSPFPTGFIHSSITPTYMICRVFHLGCRLQDLTFHSLQLVSEKMLIFKRLVIIGAYLWQPVMGNTVLLPWHKVTGSFSWIGNPSAPLQLPRVNAGKHAFAALFSLCIWALQGWVCSKEQDAFQGDSKTDWADGRPGLPGL